MNFFDLFNGNKEEQEKNQNPKENTVPKPELNLEAGKEHIFNLIIVDESGSMGALVEPTITGVNETINTIREAQKQFGDKQQHFLSLVTFDSPGTDNNAVRTLINCNPIDKVGNFQDYCPHGCTPLYDAIGLSVNYLENLIKDDPDASGVVTILTDGLENSSREYKLSMIKELIEALKEKGWTFNYMGSAHDVEAVTRDLSIDNVVEFSHDAKGTKGVWEKERAARFRLFNKKSADWDDMIGASIAEKIERKKRQSQGYFDE